MGAGIFTCAIFLVSRTGISISLSTGIVVYIVLFGAGLVVAHKRRAAMPAPDGTVGDFGAWEFNVLFVAAGILAIIATAALYWPPYSWDAVAAWVFKGRLIASKESLALLGLAAATSYPLNLSLQIAYLYLLGSDAIHALFPIYFASLALVLYSNLAHFAGRGIALVCALFLLAVPFYEYHATIAYANLPFAFYYVASTLYLYRFLKEKKNPHLIISAILLGLGTWTRSEAPLYAAINGLVLILFSEKNRTLFKHALGFALIVALFWTPWNVYWRVAGYEDFLVTGSASLADLFAGRFAPARVSEIIGFFAGRVVAFQDWGLLWLAFPLALVIGLPFLREHAALLALILLNFFGLIFMFYAAGRDTAIPMFQWLYLSFDRMALHWTPLIPFYFGLVMKESNLLENVASKLRAKLDPYLVMLILFSLFAIGPLLGPGYFWAAHDGRHSVYFLFEFDRAIQDGIFYPRWAPDFTFGYGYPFFNIYAPGAFYLGEALHLLGLDFVTATKTVFALAILLSGPAMFGFVRRLTGSSQAAFLSGLVYVYIPYHIVDIYVRAALAELVALNFLPLTLWGFYETVLHPTRKTILVAALAYGAMHFTHNGIALLFTPVLAIWVLFLMIGERKTQGTLVPRPASLIAFIRPGLAALAAVLLGIGIAAIFVIPAVGEFSYVRTDQWLANYYDYTNHFAYLFQLLSPFWGFGISVAGPHDQMSFQLGVVPALLAIFSMVPIMRNSNGMRRFWIFFFAMTALAVFLMLSISLPIWETLRLVTFAQFPWRLLTLTNLSLSILAGAVLLTDNSEGAADARSLSLPTILLGALIVFGSYPYLTAQTSVDAKEGPVGILGLFKFQQSAGEMTGVTAWVEEVPTWSPMADVLFAGKRVKSKIDYSDFNPDVLWYGVEQRGLGLRSNGETVEYDAKEDNLPVTWNIDYYPGWHVYLADKTGDDLRITRELQIQVVGEHGRIQVRVPQGRHWLLLRFEDTPPRIAGMWISAASILIALVLWFFKRQKRAYPAVK